MDIKEKSSLLHTASEHSGYIKKIIDGNITSKAKAPSPIKYPTITPGYFFIFTNIITIEAPANINWAYPISTEKDLKLNPEYEPPLTKATAAFPDSIITRTIKTIFNIPTIVSDIPKKSFTFFNFICFSPLYNIS